MLLWTVAKVIRIMRAYLLLYSLTRAHLEKRSPVSASNHPILIMMQSPFVWLMSLFNTGPKGKLSIPKIRLYCKNAQKSDIYKLAKWLTIIEGLSSCREKAFPTK